MAGKTGGKKKDKTEDDVYLPAATKPSSFCQERKENNKNEVSQCWVNNTGCSSPLLQTEKGLYHGIKRMLSLRVNQNHSSNEVQQRYISPPVFSVQETKEDKADKDNGVWTPVTFKITA